MLRRKVSVRRSPLVGQRNLTSPILVGLALWLGFPTIAAKQDMTSLISGGDSGAARWGAFVERAVAGSVHQGEMKFVDAMPTGTISGAGVRTAELGAVAFSGKTEASDTPDEARIHRADKQGRILKVAPVAPPKAFNAGSVFERQSWLRPVVGGTQAMAFVKPEIKGKEIQIASAFYVRQEKRKDPGVPAMLASLITNDKADILATAYAPAKPDYAKASPFASLLKEEDPNAGRFVPPLAPGDHAWMKEPLPAHVFTSAEQKCLATAIYFEARGESLRGQAAVAQVVLNRVRNPTYPGTVCGVVYQNSNWRNRCQFSFACDGIPDRVLSPAAYKTAEEIAMAVTAGKIFIEEVGSSTHYYAQYVSPRWARSMEKMKKIGLHIFYRTYGGGWS
ncbi:Cell wall hydrolase CwlJ, involved in spore germination [Mesorhizobium australicum]|uniref:Cell wall hydrolase CwlJ, involved in spore germination n=1 Tax=Mesorhizobium australicum TaxID=536018 RepID=A0A1X7NSM9_9HYPH|nr:Cell wall hydrolase CwlJ, involved in spore germination [Mesorhizobium australicum]